MMSTFPRQLTSPRTALFIFVFCALATFWSFSRDERLEIPGFAPPPSLGVVDFLLVFPGQSDLKAFAPAACGLQAQGYKLLILLASAQALRTSSFETSACSLQYEVLPRVDSAGAQLQSIEGWVARMERPPHVVIYAPGAQFDADWIPPLDGVGQVVVKLPREDLGHSDWMGSLRLPEWDNWHIPQVELTVITQDRLPSLERLIHSLKAAHYFGDKIRLRINIDRKADAPTLGYVDRLHWEAGPLSALYRIRQGGLIAAVSESWFPVGNSTYGIILEDDIELSPNFYAWAKMNLLRYRHGLPENFNDKLFGISLYNQQSQEMRRIGQDVFDAPKIFSGLGMPNPHTPYLSQVPCSWGAVYFPEHWREFHAFLDMRLENKGPGVLAPGVASNEWGASWKRYFIELVYLRGYAMLYPNFERAQSLSTNHVEVGEHLGKDAPKGLQAEIRKSLSVPLMDVETSLLSAGSLPAWEDLPVVDLKGYVSSLKEIAQRGRDRTSNCPSQIPFDAASLLCPGLS